MNEVKAEIDLDKVFCLAAKKFGLDKFLLKAVASVESSLNPKAYRFEPEFWERYLKDKPEWKDKDPKKVSASYGLMQLMFTTAWMLGFRGEPEELYSPVINISLGAKLLSGLMKEITPQENLRVWPQDIALARYNGGKKGNPDEAGMLRNYAYVIKVKARYWKLRMEGKDCD